MRHPSLLAAVAASALTLAACSEAPEAETETAEETAAATDMEADMADASGVIDASTATQEQLTAIDGMTPELAAAIVEGQPYASVVELNDAMVAATDEATAASLLETVFVPVNLNDATEEQLRLIPGMTDKMVHEFEEYRPYADMAEFDREIGKYVDEEEVARFRQYVTL